MSRVLEPRLLSAAPVLRRAVIGYAVLSVIGTALTIAQAGVLAELIAGIVAGGTHQLTGHLVTLAVVGVLRALTSGALEWLAATASTRTRAQLRAAVLAAVRRLGPSWAARQPAGRLVTAAGPGLEALDGYVARALPASVAALIAPVAVLARIGSADWRTAVILLACLPLVPLFMALVGVTTRNRMRRQYEILARIAGHFLDLVAGLPTLRVYGRTDHQLRTVRAATESYRRHTMATLRVAFLSGLVLDLIATLSVAVVAVDVGLRLDHRSLSLSTALLVLLLAPELFAPLRALGAQHHASEQGRAAAEAALAVIGEADPIEATEATEATEAIGATEATDAIEAAEVGAAETGGRGGDTVVERADGALSLRGVHVRYPERGEPALDGLDLDIAAGSVVALRGPSGGGKSTLLSCVLALIAPAQGTITVRVDSAERDLAGLDPASWRACTAWLAQRPRTTHATVGEEVACGDPDATEREVADAIETCHAPHPRTPLGEAASRISAGQLRRVALARAVLRARRVAARGSVPIVLLDEPSEDLDRETELVVAAVVAQLAGTATVVMATHSDALAEVADRVVRIDAGRVVSDVTQAPRRVHVVPQTPVRIKQAQVVPAPEQRRVTVPLRSRGVIAAAALCGLTGLAGLALTATSLWLICRAAQHPNIQALAVAVVGVRTFALARSLLRYGERLVTHDTALRLLSDVRVRVFAALVPLVPRGIDLRRGDALRRFVTDVDGLQDGLVRAVVPIAGAALTGAGAIVLATALTPAAGAILAAGLALGLVVTPVAVRWAAGRGERAAALAAARDTVTASFLDGIAELTAYGADARVADRITALDADFGAAVRRPRAAGVAGVVATGIVGALTLPAVLSAGAAAVHHRSSGALTVPVLAACVLVGFDALSGLPVAWAAWNGFRAGLTRVAQLLSAPVPVPEPERAACPPAGALGLNGDAVSVAPAIGVAALVDGLDLAVRAGERVALIGPSGCGKSTVLAAALRLAPVRAGHLSLGDQLRSVPIESLASADVPPLVAGSLQGDHVFDATLRDNLRVVRPEATDAQLDAVAARVNLDGFVRGLPMGWDTPAGADGSALSGGQRQRLLLARALLADPKILVLDEPTAHLDPDTERAVLRDVLAVTAGRTVLLSTHRDLPDGAVDAVLDLAARDRMLAEARAS